MTTRSDVPHSWDERTTLMELLDYARATAVEKCAGLSDEQAGHSLLPGSPLMTPGGLLSHLRWVEYFWIEVVFLGREEDAPWTEEDPDREMRIGSEIPLATLVADYQRLTAGYSELLAGYDLDHRAERAIGNREKPTLRWVLLHLLEETSRHNGHLDILRELTDGTTGT